MNNINKPKRGRPKRSPYVNYGVLLNVNLSNRVHVYADTNGMTLSKVTEQALEYYLNRDWLRSSNNAKNDFNGR